MAITPATPQNARVFGASASVPCSAKGMWATCVNSASATAQSPSDLIRPGAVTAAAIVPIPIGKGTTRVLLRCRYSAAGAITTQPVIRVIGAYDSGAGLITTTFPDDGTVRYLILSTAQTVTCAPTTDVRDATYSYSVPIVITGTDMLGADYLIVFMETAASIAGAQDEIIEALLIN